MTAKHRVQAQLLEELHLAISIATVPGAGLPYTILTAECSLCIACLILQTTLASRLLPVVALTLR